VLGCINIILLVGGSTFDIQYEPDFTQNRPVEILLNRKIDFRDMIIHGGKDGKEIMFYPYFEPVYRVTTAIKIDESKS
jgi:hypothetical protein